MSDDLISRREVIQAIRNERVWVDENIQNPQHHYHIMNETTRILSIIGNLPSVQPKTGHWIEDAKTYYGELKKRSLGVDEYTPYFTDDIACSECLAKYSVLDNETQFFKYCPNCGAKMEEKER